MSCELGKLSARVTVPTAWTVTVTEVPAATATVTVVAAGNTYTEDICAAVAAALTANATLVGTYSCSVDDGAVTSTGRVTLSASGITSFTLTWNYTDLRDLLGFTGNLTPTAASFTSTKAAKYLWLPNCRRAPAMGPDGVGSPRTDLTVTVSPSGVSKALAYATRYVDTFGWEFVTGRKAWATYETYANESAQSFFLNALGAGLPFRYHADRSVDGTYSEWRSTSGEYAPQPADRRHTSSASSLWRYQFEAVKLV